MLRWLGRGLAALAGLAVLGYMLDFGVWWLRGAGGMGTVQVTRFVVAPLKGGKEEYYPDGTRTVDCSRSVFPQSGEGACWWLARKPTVYDR